jgi:hypothetical protein
MAKTVVEDCYKLTVHVLRPYLSAGWWGSVRWSRGEQETGNISYRVLGDGIPTAIRLMYNITKWDEEKISIDYTVPLTTTVLAWGAVRYWFVCPLRGCGRRVGCLYLPPGGNYFGCRHCYDLAYESNQEGIWPSLFDSLEVALMRSDYPGITRKDVRALNADKTTPHMKQLERERYLRELQNYDPHEGYLSADELCRKCKLSRANLSKLQEARLLLQDTTDGRYRPKLVGWGRKLAYLLQKGWSIEEIQAWSKERWKSKNPKQWPPDSR